MFSKPVDAKKTSINHEEDNAMEFEQARTKEEDQKSDADPLAFEFGELALDGKAFDWLARIGTARTALPARPNNVPIARARLLLDRKTRKWTCGSCKKKFSSLTEGGSHVHTH